MSDLERPTKSIRLFAPLDARDLVIQQMRNFSDFAVVDHDHPTVPVQFADRRNDGRRTGAEHLVQLAGVRSGIDLVDRYTALTL